MMGNLSKRTGTAGEVDFAYDENGRMLSQDYGSSRLDYVYGPGSYAVSSATGHTPMDAGRNASRANNFAYDASGRMMHDSSRGLSIAYDMDGMPAVFLQDSGSGTWRELAVYDPSGWRVATYSYENGSLVSLRTDIMLDGRKELERRASFAGSGSSVTEYSMLYGAGGALGRRHADGTSEWYVKDRQGSLVMSVVNSGLNTALVYEPFGFQRLLRVSGDEPAEQYTGKEYDGRLGLYYFGARYFDPSFALWLTPDPARQYLNPYSYGGDPVNVIDYDGRLGWAGILGIVELATGGMVSSVVSGVAGVAAVTADAATGPAAPMSLLTSLYANDWDLKNPNVRNSFTSGLYVDLAGGMGPASTYMTMLSYGQRCRYGDCGAVFTDAITGGFFADNVGHYIGLSNVKNLGGTADWYKMDGVSEYYRGNTVYSGGFMNYAPGSFAHFGHATFVTDRTDSVAIAHEIHHSYQMEDVGWRIMYYYDYMEQSDWDPTQFSSSYHSNSKEMDAYFIGYLREKGLVNKYGEGIEKLSAEEIREYSKAFYNNYRKEHADEAAAITKKFGEQWVWEEGWWRGY
ncbi:RHS repeat-associated core domain-containing protein [uncultured Fibrobacter sp.]|uniref:RHS repeat-associated core domain-containing protein n=1 Tax=uncultured Fibrobacter sp. TaxID=261512 RepID=UPI002608ACEE|nr:RHS repeat-associated core domain-containing protein [uncultured Fibrobacter sp.]